MPVENDKTFFLMTCTLSSSIDLGRATVGEMLVQFGVPREKLLQRIHAELFSWPIQLSDLVLRHFTAGNLATAEWEFVRDLAECACIDDVELAVYHYQAHPFRSRSLLRVALGGIPRRAQVRRFYCDLRSRWQARRPIESRPIKDPDGLLNL